MVLCEIPREKLTATMAIAKLLYPDFPLSNGKEKGISDLNISLPPCHTTNPIRFKTRPTCV